MSPSNLRKALTKISPQFRGNGQHDSQELLRCLLDGLGGFKGRRRRHLSRYRGRRIRRSWRRRTARHWRAYINANASPVSDNFAGLLRSTVECCKCGFKSIRYDPYSICRCRFLSKLNLISGARSRPNSKRFYELHPRKVLRTIYSY